MSIPNLPLQTPFQARIPLDLSDWAGRRGLACQALEAATEVGGRAFKEFNDQQALTRAKTLLALLTYCYAVGIYASDEIELLAMDDAMARYLSGHIAPEWGRLRAFRRQWHAVLHESLAKVFTLAWSSYLSGAEGDYPPCVSLAQSEPVALDPAIARAFHIEVERRINRAVLLDSMFADE